MNSLNVLPHYSPGLCWDKLVFVSGQLSIAPGAPLAPAGDFEAQCRQALANVFSVLKAAGADREYVLKVTAFIVGIEHWATFNRVYAELFGDVRPARSVVPVSELHFGCLVEIEAIAALPAEAARRPSPVAYA